MSIIFVYVVPPNITASSDDLFYERVAGESITLNCSATGYPVPAINWSFPNQYSNEVEAQIKTTIDNSSLLHIVHSTLELKNLDLINVGEYSCESYNDLVEILNDTSEVTEIILTC